MISLNKVISDKPSYPLLFTAKTCYRAFLCIFVVNLVANPGKLFPGNHLNPKAKSVDRPLALAPDLLPADYILIFAFSAFFAVCTQG